MHSTKHFKLWLWLTPVGLQIGLALGFFYLTAIFDFPENVHWLEYFKQLWFSEPKFLNNAISNLIELTAAILGISLTVVAIVLQLSAQRYTPKLIDFFLLDKVNISVFAFMVFTVSYAVLLTYSIKSNFYPIYSSMILVCLVILCLAILIPYFAYVFNFLTPSNIIIRLNRNIRFQIGQIKRFGPKPVDYYQREVSNSIEQISDIALNSIVQMDRTVCLLAIYELQKAVLHYQKEKVYLPTEWFDASRSFFLGISKIHCQDLVNQKIWLEARVFMEFELMFKTALNKLPDVVSQIALTTTKILEKATSNADRQTLTLLINYYNTFIRLALNAKNQKAIFSLFYQYRQMAEYLLDFQQDLLLQKIAFYFKYYAQQSLQNGLWFACTTTCYDLGLLLQQAFNKKARCFGQLLVTMLQFDNCFEDSKDVNLIALDGARKALLVLAAYLQSKGDTIFVQQIAKFLKNKEPQARLVALKNQLLEVQDPRFWEITDRGVNFEYISDAQKESLQTFYDRYLKEKEIVLA